MSLCVHLAVSPWVVSPTTYFQFSPSSMWSPNLCLNPETRLYLSSLLGHDHAPQIRPLKGKEAEGFSYRILPTLLDCTCLQAKKVPAASEKAWVREYADLSSVGHSAETWKHTLKWAFPFLPFHSPYFLTSSWKNVPNYPNPSSHLRLCFQEKSNYDRWHEDMVFNHLSAL